MEAAWFTSAARTRATSYLRFCARSFAHTRSSRDRCKSRFPPPANLQQEAIAQTAVRRRRRHRFRTGKTAARERRKDSTRLACSLYVPGMPRFPFMALGGLLAFLVVSPAHAASPMSAFSGPAHRAWCTPAPTIVRTALKPLAGSMRPSWVPARGVTRRWCGARCHQRCTQHP